METTKEARFIAFVFAVILIVLCILMQQSTQAQKEQNDLLTEADNDRQSAEYQRILIGCNTAGAIESTDPFLRELCDEYLVTIRNG